MDNKKEKSLIKLNTGLSLWFIGLAIIGFLIILLPLVNDSYDFAILGTLGDTVGGFLNPLIGIAAALLTFLAFYIQYQANQQIQEQFKIQQFDNQFYEMLRLHKENVNELYIKISKKKGKTIVENTIYGRSVFEYLVLELTIAYMVALYSFKKENLSPKQLLNEAYGIFFHGLSDSYLKKHIYFKNLDKLQKLIKKFNYKGFDTEIHKQTKLTTRTFTSKKIEFQIFEGHNHQLAHYYRQLYQIVKFVVNNQNQYVTYEIKRNYLRILRAQLSNTEQVLLFYNWYSTFGKQWEDGNNNFFTDYRLIHNLYGDLLISDFDLEEIFDINGDYLKEKGRIRDSLFEYQDWFEGITKN